LALINIVFFGSCCRNTIIKYAQEITYTEGYSQLSVSLFIIKKLTAAHSWPATRHDTSPSLAAAEIAFKVDATSLLLACSTRTNELFHRFKTSYNKKK
jgi:hypothetical protein